MCVMEGKPSIFTLFMQWLAHAHTHIHLHILIRSFTHAWPLMHAWPCTRTHSRCSKPIIQSESAHKFSPVLAACPVKVRALFLSEPAVWQILTSSIDICAQPASSSSRPLFLLHVPALHILHPLPLVFIHSPCRFPCIHSPGRFILIPPFKFPSISILRAILPSLSGVFELKLVSTFSFFRLRLSPLFFLCSFSLIRTQLRPSHCRWSLWFSVFPLALPLSFSFWPACSKTRKVKVYL